MASRRGFGSIRKLPSKKYQASYTGPDGRRHTAPTTFAGKMDAEGWLVGERTLIERDAWVPPPYREQARLDAAAAAEAEREAESITVTKFIRDWLPTVELRPTTRRDYESLLRNHVAPSLDEVALRDLTKARVKRWWEALDPEKPRARSKAFQFLHTAMNAAVELDLMAINPVTLPRRTRVRTKTARRIQPLSMMELETLADAMPAHLSVAVLIGGWCGLRYGELAELRRRDDPHRTRRHQGCRWLSGGATEDRGRGADGAYPGQSAERTSATPAGQHGAWDRRTLVWCTERRAHALVSVCPRIRQGGGIHRAARCHPPRAPPHPCLSGRRYQRPNAGDHAPPRTHDGKYDPSLHPRHGRCRSEAGC